MRRQCASSGGVHCSHINPDPSYDALYNELKNSRLKWRYLINLPDTATVKFVHREWLTLIDCRIGAACI